MWFLALVRNTKAGVIARLWTLERVGLLPDRRHSPDRHAAGGRAGHLRHKDAAAEDDAEAAATMRVAVVAADTSTADHRAGSTEHAATDPVVTSALTAAHDGSGHRTWRDCHRLVGLNPPRP